MYASKTLTEHLLRGALSVLVLWLAVNFSSAAPWGLLVAFPVAVLLWRGCPTCWLVGLANTVAHVAAGKGIPEDACLDGRCALRPPPGAGDKRHRGSTPAA